MRFPLLTAALVVGTPLGLAFAQSPVQSSGFAPANKAPVKVVGNPTPQTFTSSLIGGSDDCANAAANDAITGPGTYAVDNTLATSGAPLAACGAIGNDVWFFYTATATGNATVSTCGGIGGDSVIGIWADGVPSGSCPTTPILCLDDSCGLQTAVSFPVTAGTKYFIELGGFSGSTYSGTFAVTESVPTGNDSCALPQALVGNGPHPFDTTGATTGAEGQAEPLCLSFGSTNIYNDLWFTWTATATSTFEVSLCGTTGHDSRLAVYAGAGCPVAGSAIACNDDSCGLVSATCFSAISGQSYTIQVGAYGTTGFGPGTIQFTPVAPPAGGCTPTDDGSTENSLGWTAGGTMVWMTGFGAPAQSATVSSVDTTFGTPLFPGFYVPQGNVTVAVWDDPNDDGVPNDLVLLGTGTAAVSAGSIDSDVFQTVTLTSPVIANGVFFVGAAVTHNSGEFVAPIDQTATGGGACGSGPGSWFFGANAPTADLTNPSANQYPPATLASALGANGNWLVRPNCGPGSTGTAYCFGDGTGTACPCGNNGAAGNGCANSLNAAGANLSATGVAVVGADTVVLAGTGMPGNSSCLYFQGTSQISIAFGDGLRCAGGTVIRLGTKTNSGGASQYPVGADQPVSIRGLVPSGATRSYQIWYRNAAAFCTASTFNLSNGLSITWQ